MNVDIFNIINKATDDKTLLQLALNDCGCNLIVDGIIGPKTMKCAKKVKASRFGIALNVWLEEVFGLDFCWIKEAFKEIGTKEIRGEESNERIEEYHDYAHIGWAKDDIPWCGSFMAYVFTKCGYDIPIAPYRALSWLNFGKEIDEPLYGSIAIKKRMGGGHVTIVIGSYGEWVYCLGGNQSDKVCIRKYKKSDFISFRLPENIESRIVLKDINAKRYNKER